MRMMYNWAAGPDGEGEGPQHGRGANDEGHTERKVGMSPAVRHLVSIGRADFSGPDPYIGSG